MMMPELRSALPLSAIAALVLSATACSHSDAFVPADPSTDQPLVATPPLRLTYSALADLTPAWLPDGTGFIYAFGNAESRQQNDQCLGIMGGSGGSLRSVICNPAPFASDSTDTFSWPAVSPGGRLAYVRASRPLSARTDLTTTLVVGPLNDPSVYIRARSFPFQGSAGQFYLAAADPAWLADDRLAFLGLIDTSVFCPDPPLCRADPILVRSGRDILLADISGDAVTITPVSGTAWATSVTAAPGEDQIYFTVAGSSRVLQKLAPEGPVATVYDFGPTGIVRDVQAAASGRFVAIVGGLLRVFTEQGNSIQQDNGGRLFVVDPETGTASELAAPATIFRNPSLAPDGGSVIAEAYHLTITPRPGPGGVTVADTVVTAGPDLWEFSLR